MTLRRVLLFVVAVLLARAFPYTLLVDGVELQGQRLQPRGRIQLPQGIPHEVSGLARSGTSGRLWFHNDSGDQARIFACDEEGHLLTRSEGIRVVGARNFDWEDIAWNEGSLWIADSGDNLNLPLARTLYRVIEPSPQVGSVDCAESLSGPVRLPWWSWQKDSEACFFWRDEAYLITKGRQPLTLVSPCDEAYLMRWDGSAFVPVSRARELGGWVTAADVDPSGRFLAVLVHMPRQALILWRLPSDPQDQDIFAQPAVRFTFHGAGQCEALCFLDEHRVMIANEPGEFFHIDVTRLLETLR